MKLLFSLLSAAVLCGCATSRPRHVATASPVRYWQVVSSDFEGHWTAEYIAEGGVRKMSEQNGFAFTAVQRRIFKPVPLEFRYPLGRPVSVIASNVVAKPVPKPLWLERLDAGLPPIQTQAGPR